MVSVNMWTVVGNRLRRGDADVGTWLTRVLDMAWAAQNDPWYSAEEKSQILAWSYGFATHSAGDHFAHTLVNEFADALRQSDEGAYVGFLADEGEGRVRAAYPGSTWDRLRSIKGKYDPDNFFRLNQNIPPAAAP